MSEFYSCSGAVAAILAEEGEIREMAAENTGSYGTTPPQEPPTNESEFCSGTEMGIAFISGWTFDYKAVVYYDVEGMALIEGDIVIGTVEEVQQTMAAIEGDGTPQPMEPRALTITGTGYRWPGGW